MSEAGTEIFKRRRSRAEAEHLITEYEASELSGRCFYSKHGLSVVELDMYRKLQQQLMPRADSRLVPVELLAGVSERSASAGGDSNQLWVEFPNGRRIAVGRGFDAPTLERLVSLLERA